MSTMEPSEFVSAYEAREAEHPDIGAGTADTAPHEPPAVSLLAGQPAAIVGTIIAVIDAVLVAAVPLPEWLTSILVAVVTSAAHRTARRALLGMARIGWANVGESVQR